MARSKFVISAILFCLLITVSLADPTTKKEDDDTVQASDVVPMNKLTLRPVNRRFPFNPHHLERHVAVIPNGEEDAALSQGENGDFENPLYHHHHHHRFHHHHFYDHHHHHHHHEDSDSDSDDDLVDDGNQRSKKSVFRRYSHDGIIEENALRRFRKHHHGSDHDHHHGARVGFMKRLHKFFDRFF